MTHTQARTAPPKSTRLPVPPPPGGPAARPMQVRKFVAPTMSDALRSVKQELGGGAVILSTRSVRSRRLLGLIRRDHVEVTAGVGIRTVGRRPQPNPLPGDNLATGELSPQAKRLLKVAATHLRQQAKPPEPTSRPVPAGLPGRDLPGRDLLATPAATNAAYLGVTRELGDLKRMVGDLVVQIRTTQTPDLPAPLQPWFQGLRRQQIDESLARDLVTKAAATADPQDQPAFGRALEAVVAGLLRVRTPPKDPVGRPRVVALIGPTGVGKTTTIAKLAANFALTERKTVGLITIDTYRIAAIDQLRKYAQIIRAPLEVVSSPAEIGDALAKMGDRDLVLIDTAGRSPRDAVKLRELREFLDKAAPDEVHLVLSATCGVTSTRLAVERFSGVRADSMILTKLDEAAELGLVVEAADRTGLPLSYVTTGQDVPSDIETADPARLARQIVTAAGTDGADSSSAGHDAHEAARAA